MQWDETAETAVSRIPFFVRKKVKKRVEEEARRAGASRVTLRHVEESRRLFLGSMEREVKGWQLETCFGPGGCPNRAVGDDGLAERLEEALSSRKMNDFLKKTVQGPLKFHHEFRVSVSDCPNACSRPQIVDFGLIGSRRPSRPSGEACTACGACIEICKETAIMLETDGPAILDPDLCLGCGQCLAVCPAGALEPASAGYRILIGGKLGRRPRLGRELSGLFSADEALRALETCLDYYLAECRQGERLGEIMARQGDAGLVGRIMNKKKTA